MCDVCGQAPCANRCPNHEDRIIGTCATCGKDIWDYYERYTDYDGNLFCDEDCAKDFYGIREDDK